MAPFTPNARVLPRRETLPKLSRLRTDPPIPSDSRRGFIRRFDLWSLAFLAIVWSLTTAAGAATLPVGEPVAASASPSRLEDRFEIRLAPAAARARFSTYRTAERTGSVEALGIAAIDRVATQVGAMAFEPEFRGETPPPFGSDHVDFTAFYLVRLAPGANLDRALAEFRSLADVKSADPIAVLPVSTVPNDSLWNVSTWFYQPSRHDIHAPEAWNITTGDTSIVVAILDTGVLTDHPDIGGTVAGSPGQIWTNAAEANGTPGRDDDGNGFIDDVHGWDFVNRGSGVGLPAGEDCCVEDNDPNDFAGHGTVVAGLVGALSNNAIGVTGTAWNVRLMPVRVAWSDNASLLGRVDMSYAAQGIRYATRAGARVINCSFATQILAGLDAAAAEAAAAGVTIVCAAGNDGQDHELAERADVVAVGATDASDQVAAFSNRGDFVDLCAPGVGIVSTYLEVPRTAARNPAYSPPFDGTSMSAPLVSGAVALLQSLRHQRGESPMSAIDVLLRLRDTADDLTSLNATDSGFGAGRLNLERLLAEPRASSAMHGGALTVGPAAMIVDVSGKRRVAWATTDQKLLLLDGRDDTLRVVSLPAPATSGVSAADASPGRPAWFVSLTGNRVAGYDAGGDPLPGWPVTVPGTPVALSIPALGDVDGDGTIEVVCGASNGRVWAWHVNGSVVTGFPVTLGSGITGSVALSDLDGAPGVEVVASAEQGDVYAFRGDGTVLPDWPVYRGIPITAPVVGRMADDSLAILVAAGEYLYALAPDAGTRFVTPLTGTAGSFAAQDPALGDLDGDGADEIVVATQNPTTLAVFDGHGNPRTDLGWPRSLSAPATGPPVIGRLLAPEAGAARQSILWMAANDLIAYDDHAARLPTFPKPGQAGRFPSLVDLDGSGTTQVLAGAGADSFLYVYNGANGSRTGAFPWFTPRGNFARTGSRDYAPPLSALDDVAPAMVNDLQADSVGATGLRLAWHAPGDDGVVGQAASYEVRGATFPLDDQNFSSGTRVTGIPSPAPAGSIERTRVTGLAVGVTYYFALIARDDAGNASPLSNVAVATTGNGAPGRVLDLRVTAVAETSVTLAWTAAGDDGASGQPIRYLVRTATTPIDPAHLDLVRTDSVGANLPGTLQSLTVAGLSRGHVYWFAVQAGDEGGLLAELSNQVEARTGVGGPLAGVDGIALAPGANPSRLPVKLYWLGAETVGATQSIVIFDSSGRRIRKLELGTEAGGIVEWNGRDDRGGFVPAGVYFARLFSGSVHAHTRVVLLP